VAGDGDGDGHSVEDGDCDDEDPSIYPSADDSECNGIDEDCDGWPDDEWAGDWYEPNDLVGYELGAIDGTVYELNNGAIHPEIDEDRFRFWVTDSTWDFFNVDVDLVGVPGTADLALSLYFVEDTSGESGGLVDASDEPGLGGGESVSTREGLGDQTGWYEVVVYSSDGSSCTDTYTLIIDANSR